MADDPKTLGLADYAVNIMELIPVLVATGMALEQAISWGISKLNSYKGGGVPTDADWSELRAFRIGKKAELKLAIQRLVAIDEASAS